MLKNGNKIYRIIKFDGEDIGLYIMQEPDLKCFKVQMFLGENTLIMVLEKKGLKWEYITENIPKWADAILPGLIQKIKQRFFVEFN